MSRPIRLASTFHDMAWPFLSGLEFELENDPSELGNPYLGTRAIYKSQNGFFLAVGFNPLDGSHARMMCGRSWNYTSDLPGLQRFEQWSNDYFVLAKRFGIELPKSYQLDVNDVANTDLQLILDDLEETLPTIIDRVTVDDLVAIEREEHGCQWREDRDFYQSAGTKFEGITPFEPRQSSE